MTASNGLAPADWTVSRSAPPREVILDSLGQLFVMGFDGVRIPDDVAEYFAAFRIGGILLFRDNYESLRQVSELIAGLRSRCQGEDRPLWVFVDQEGGPVQNFRESFPALPSAAELGRGPAEQTRRAHTEMARRLNAVGVDISTVPVADLAAPGAIGSIGERSFGTDPVLVSQHVRATVNGLHDAGILACAKHFPGHGATLQDSHRELPLCELPMQQLWERDLLPFRAAVSAGVDMVMTAHVAYQASPEPDKPATLSGFWIRKVLRQELGFRGVVVADALEMRALRHLSPFERGIQALEAGCDLLVFYREAVQFDAFNRIRYHVRAGDLDSRQLAVSLARIAQTKNRRRSARVSSPERLSEA